MFLYNSFCLTLSAPSFDDRIAIILLFIVCMVVYILTIPLTFNFSISIKREANKNRIMDGFEDEIKNVIHRNCILRLLEELKNAKL